MFWVSLPFYGFQQFGQRSIQGPANKILIKETIFTAIFDGLLSIELNVGLG